MLILQIGEGGEVSCACYMAQLHVTLLMFQSEHLGNMIIHAHVQQTNTHG